MIQFSKVRLYGFKSFVDKTELDVAPGLNGIVGPNGCGKSNLVEALRWSMGESSSKRMRGGSGSMDDVIFSGTEQRPQRNVAEVSVLLDNSKRTAPPPYNNFDEIEVVRRIERDKGSSYRINGKNVRARDVQMLYADILSGANSPFLVSQGRITEIIKAKPYERRQILEEAAGITGLYARRHEAELKLRATDRNLQRLDDLVGNLEERLREMKKQARQANKYRNLSAQIRQLEVMIASLEWRKTKEKLNDVESAFAKAEAQVAERLTVVTQLTKTQTVQAQDLPDLRKAEAESAAALQTQKLALQRLEDESERLSHQLEETKAQLEQLYKDREHEQQTLKENTGILEKLEKEEKALLANRDSEEKELEKSESCKEELQSKTNELEEAYTKLMETTANNKARKQSLEQQIEQDKQRIEALKQRLTQVTEKLSAWPLKKTSHGSVDTLRHDVQQSEEQVERLRENIGKQEDKITELRLKQEGAQETLQDSRSNRDKISSEINSLESIVKSYSQEGFKPVFDDIQTDKGFELALSRAMGDTLMASTQKDAPVTWSLRSVNEPPSLPDGAIPLIKHVKAPKEMQVALSFIGLVETVEEGDKIATDLKPGQSLVSTNGAYWRWDGLQIQVKASDRHTIQLKQKNKLAELKKNLPQAEENLKRQESIIEKIKADIATARETLIKQRQALQQAEQEIRQQRNRLDEAVTEQAERQSEFAKLEESRDIAQADIEHAETRLAENNKALANFDDATFEEQQKKIEEIRQALTEAREKLHTAIRDYEITKQEHNRRKARLQAIGDERVNLQNRCIRARERLKELDNREVSLKDKIDEVKKRPEEIKTESEALLTLIGDKEKIRAEISDKLANCEGELAETTKALKEAEAALAEVREARAHAQATTAERQRHLEEITRHIHENFDMTPEQLAGEAAISDEHMPDLEKLKEDKEQAVRGRDMIGPVNLRADQEVEELEKELGGILEEKNDLVQAVTELRQGIQKLNKEARERLEIAFKQVNGYFRQMFDRLFKGGKAHLALIDSDDPLEAGLEIFAQPPGKTLQSLTLLSGGEQTLTAIALIFAMFLTNPAPICVLDEVDAPLDDANVDRFCDLLDEFAERGETRFILITHHRLTMARMDRLYGVTMEEKGVSKLVSVDLAQHKFDFLDEVA